MAHPLKLLMAEDSPADAELILRELRRSGFSPEWHRVETEQDFIARLDPGLDIILSDFAMPEFSGPRALEVLRGTGLEIPFIIISGTIGEDAAVAAMKQGANDYLLKDRLGRLGPAVEQALEKERLRRERAQSEEALRESEERFRQLAENIHEVFWLTDVVKSRMLYISPAYETIWGRTRAELYATPESWLSAIHPDDRANVEDAVKGKQIQGKYDIEYRIIRPDGSIRWISDRAFPVADANGNVDRVAGVARDITERKQAEDVLRESERRFREMLENVDLIAMTLDRKGTITFCNDYLLKVTGWSRAEVVGADWFSKFIPNNPEVKQLFFYTIDTDQFPTHLENPIVTRDGRLREIVWNNTMLRDAAGNIVGTASIGEDVTDRNLALARVREQAEMLDHAHDAIIVRDIHTRVITFWNQGAERLYGWTAAEALGRNIAELIFDDPKRNDSTSEQLLKTGEWHGECHHLTKDRKPVIVSGNVTLVRDSNGAPRFALVINIDITGQKKLEAQFLRAQRMEGIGTLASGVAHDLNNILSPIMMSVPMLRGDLAPGLREQVVSVIETSAQRGADIVRQVLTFARGAEGRRVIVQPLHLIKEMATIARQTFSKSIAVEARYPEDPWTVECDSTQLHQVLLNLCVNARDAMPNGGELIVALENFVVDEQYAAMIPGASPGPHVVIAVSDTGTGIPAEIVDKIFDPFFTTKELGKGTGLGLSTLIGIVKSHGGFVTIESEVGRGSTFKVFLPSARADDAASPSDAHASASGKGELILVVDDEPGFLNITRNILEKHGYRVLTATDGTDGLIVSVQHARDIKAVLTDLAMPSMDGVGLVRALKKMNPATPVIMSTGVHCDLARETELRDLGINALLRKPYTAGKLLTVLRAVLDGLPVEES